MRKTWSQRGLKMNTQNRVLGYTIAMSRRLADSVSKDAPGCSTRHSEQEARAPETVSRRNPCTLRPYEGNY